MRHVRILQHADTRDIWSIGEMKFFLGDRQLAMSPQWKTSASSFPWDIGLAFDGDPVTRWRAWEPSHAGMHVDVDFGDAVMLDRIELHCAHDEWKIDVSLDGVNARLDKVDDPPFGDLRRTATAAVKARGTDYLLIGSDHYLSADIHGDPARWGLKKISARGNDWLLQIQ
jgi:hypothetical protein